MVLCTPTHQVITLPCKLTNLFDMMTKNKKNNNNNALLVPRLVTIKVYTTTTIAEILARVTMILTIMTIHHHLFQLSRSIH